MSLLNYIWASIALVLCLLLLRRWFYRLPFVRKRMGLPPLVSCFFPPFLGASLAYKKSPVQFLQDAYKKHGGVFTMDMAGCHMTMVSDPVALTAYFRAPERVLSSYDAINDFGFSDTLGKINVYDGTITHRKLIMSEMRPNMNIYSSQLADYVGQALEIELKLIDDTNHVDSKIPSQQYQTDILEYMRRVSLRATIGFLVDDELLQTHPEWINDFFSFQDDLEEAIGKAIVLPRFMTARSLAKVASKRAKLIETLQPFVASFDHQAKADGDVQRYITMLKNRAEESETEITQGKEHDYIVAEWCIGMLFAAHKNVAICAAQCVTFLSEHPDILTQVEEEVSGFSEEKDIETVMHDSDACPVLERCILETLRLCAHCMGSMRKVRAKEGFTLTSTNPNDNSSNTYVLPEGSFVFSHNRISYCEDVFPNPMDFNPDRFLAGQRRGWQRLARHAFIPFSAGVHGCPGQTIALKQIKLTVFLFLKRALEWSVSGPDSSEIPELDFDRATLAQRKAPVVLTYTSKRLA